MYSIVRFQVLLLPIALRQFLIASIPSFCGLAPGWRTEGNVDGFVRCRLVLLIEFGLKATGMIASGYAERPKSTSLCSPSRHRCDKHSRLDVTARACRMLPETLCARDATSPGPLISSEVKTWMSLSFWNPGRLYKLSPRRISWITSPPFPPFRLYPLPTAPSAFPSCFLPRSIIL